MNGLFRDAPVIFSLAAIYGLGIALGAWLLLPSDLRRRYWERLQHQFLALGNGLGGNIRRVTKNGKEVPVRLTKLLRGLIAWIVQRRHASLATILLLITPAVAVQLFGTRTAFEAYDDLAPATDSVIAALLQGERLVAPLPLPPELFITNEVERERQEIASASREWEMLDPDFRQRLLAVFRVMAGHGYQMVLLEGYRSPQRQAVLASLGTHVTNAGPYQSYHQYGLAADSAFYRNGKILISEKDPWTMEGYRLYGQYAESAGLVWGGRWQMMDFGHVELRKRGVLAKR